MIVAVVSALILAAPVASAVPTNGEGQEFSEQVQDRGILKMYYPSDHAQILADICYLQDGDIPTAAIVNVQMNAFGLSKKDASWLVNTALGYCD